MVREHEIDAVLNNLDEVNKSHISSWVRSLKLSGRKTSSIANHVASVYRFLRDSNYKDAKEITKEEIEDWYLWKREAITQTGKPPSQATMHGNIISIRTFYKFLLGPDEGKRRVAIITKMPKSKIREEELVTQEDVLKMMRECSNERDRAIVSLFFASGARLGEICAANVGDVTLHRYGASIRIDGKTGERDLIVYHGLPELKTWMNVHPVRNPDGTADMTAPLFVTHFRRGEQYHRLSDKAVQSILKRVGERAGLSETKRCNPHAMRHARATDVSDHIGVADMNLMFGWAEGSLMSQRYTHSSKRRLERVLAKQAGIKIPELEKGDVKITLQCQNCETLNRADGRYCTMCNHPLNDKVALATQKIFEEMKNK